MFSNFQYAVKELVNKDNVDKENMKSKLKKVIDEKISKYMKVYYNFLLSIKKKREMINN